MDDSSELNFVGTPQEMAQIEQSDLCVTLYTLWDTLRERGRLDGKHLYSCRNDSCVPDDAFGQLTGRTIPEADLTIDRGELFLLATQPFEQFRDMVAKTLYAALESL